MGRTVIWLLSVASVLVVGLAFTAVAVRPGRRNTAADAGGARAKLWGPDPARARRLWDDIQPGDDFGTSGGGLVGAAIRVFSSSPIGHCGKFIEKVRDIVDDQGRVVDTLWRTHEAFPPRVRERERLASSVAGVVRLWRTPAEQAAMIARSHEWVGRPYGYLEIVRIIVWWCHVHRLHAAVAAAVALVVGWVVGWGGLGGVATVALTVMVAGVLPYPTRDDPRRGICSNHILDTEQAGRPGIAYDAAAPDPAGQFTRPAHMVWPGRWWRDALQISHNTAAAVRRSCS